MFHVIAHDLQSLVHVHLAGAFQVFISCDA